MASTVSISGSMSVAGVAAITGTPVSAVLTCLGDSDVMAESQAIGFAADEEVTLNASITTTKLLMIVNLDAANAIHLSYDTTGAFATFAFADIEPGSFILFKPVFPTGKTKIYAQGHVASVTIMKYQVEA